MSDSEGVNEENRPQSSFVRWMIPQVVNKMTFIGKEVVAVAHDIFIVFYNLKTDTEIVHVVNNAEQGDGVDCVAGHRGNIFAYAEKVTNARIFISTYPAFNIMATLHDTAVNRYKSISMLENDLICCFSGFPNYLLTVWCWRTGHKLVSLETDVVRRQQIYMPSRISLSVCQCWGDGLAVWEVAPCYKKCFVMKRQKPADTKMLDPELFGVCWTSDNFLYGIDGNANLYNILSDGINMQYYLEWTDDLKGPYTPLICVIGNGLIIYGPDNCLRVLKKLDTWKVMMQYEPLDPVIKLVSNITGDVGCMWTRKGIVYKIFAESEDKVDIELFTYKQRNITQVQLIAPEYKHMVTMDDEGAMCIFHVVTGELLNMSYFSGTYISVVTSLVEPLLVVWGESGPNSGLTLLWWGCDGGGGISQLSTHCLTHQAVSKVVLSDDGRFLLAAAMAAGHIFLYKIAESTMKLSLIRYSEIGRGLADCSLMKVGGVVRLFIIGIFSDKYMIGERVTCINAETGKDNKFVGKMQGPYARLLALKTKDTAMAIPHQLKEYHVLKLASDKGSTVSVKVAAIVGSGHAVRQFDAACGGALLTFGHDGDVTVRRPHAAAHYDWKFTASHRYEKGIKSALIDENSEVIITLARNHNLAVYAINQQETDDSAKSVVIAPLMTQWRSHKMYIFPPGEKTYLDLQEEKKVKEEKMDFKKQRQEVVTTFKSIQKKLVELLEENLAEIPLHQLPLAEFDLHLEKKRERMKEAEWEREKIRQETEARIRAQDRVTAWIKKQCWDTMLQPRTKLYAIFSHYQVENYACLPMQQDRWPELVQIEKLRGLEMEKDDELFTPWEEIEPEVASSDKASAEVNAEEASQLPSAITLGTVRDVRKSVDSADAGELAEEAGEPYVLSGTSTHKFVPVPPYMIPQTLAFSYLQMNWLHHITKLNVQNLRVWFNKQFDDLMAQKKKEVSLVEERNARLRFIIEELNKLSDLRGSFHHLIIPIKDPPWSQDEIPQKLIKVDPEECSIEPYVSPSQVVVPPPEPKPKDDFRERALIDMMDGVLEKLWHEEIKKIIPKPNCMLMKEPEQFNEEELRQVFEYESRVAVREEERARYRKMLHAEHAKLAAALGDALVNFNGKVKEMWLTKMKIDSVIGQENLNLMRLRRVNLDRLELDEKLDELRSLKQSYESDLLTLSSELDSISEQSQSCQASYELLAAKDKALEKSFRNNFADLPPIVFEISLKRYKKRPKWVQRSSMTPDVLYDMATALMTRVRPPLLHPDTFDYLKGCDQQDLITNMPTVMDEVMWNLMTKMRRTKIENEIRMRGMIQEMAFIDNASNIWNRAIAARRTAVNNIDNQVLRHRHDVELASRNNTIQLVIPAGQVEISTSGHMEDFEDAVLMPRIDIEEINNLIIRMGLVKLRMMRAQVEFRRAILAREWQHAQCNMKLAHLRQELYSYRRLKIPKELQYYLKNKEKGYTEERDYILLEKEMEATKASFNKSIGKEMHVLEEIQLKTEAIEAEMCDLDKLINKLTVKTSERRLLEDPFEPIRIRKCYKNRMELIVSRARLIREVQGNHSRILLLQTELELLRLKTYPTLANYTTLND